MGWIVTWIAAGLLAGGSGQGQAPTGAAAGAQEQGAPEARLEALQQEFEAAQQEFFKAYRAAKTDEEREAAMKLQPDTAAFAKRYRALALDAAGSPVAAKAWSQVLSMARERDLAEEAVVALMAHLDDPAAAELPMQVERAAWMLGAPRTEELLRELREKAPTTALKASATFHLGTHLVEHADGSEVRKGEGKELLAEVRSKYADQPHPWRGTYGEAAESWLFQLERLQPGMVAPEIEGKDLQGQPMKLSDFRGKVVLLDFWGNW